MQPYGANLRFSSRLKRKNKSIKRKVPFRNSQQRTPPIGVSHLSCVIVSVGFLMSAFNLNHTSILLIVSI